MEFFYPNMNKQAVLYSIFLLFGFIAFSQTKVGGVVKDSSGETVPFANVVFKNSSEGTTSNENGEFYLQSSSSYDTITISFIGYATRDVALQKAVNMNLEIILQEEASSLDEVVIYRGKTPKKGNPAIEILKKSMGQSA